MNGPMTTPALVAAEIHPSALARSPGAIVSATYACATPVVPPPNPWTIREATSSLWMLFASRIVQGLGGGTTGVAQAYVADTMAPGERAKALGWISAATSAGVVIGPFIGSVAHRFGTEMPGIVAALLVLVNVYFAWKWLPESRVAHTHTSSGRQLPPGRSVRQALREIMDRPTEPAHRVIWIYV